MNILEARKQTDEGPEFGDSGQSPSSQPAPSQQNVSLVSNFCYKFLM